MRMPPVGRMPISRICLPMAQALRTCVEEALAVVRVAHRRAAAGAAPDRRDERADLQAVAGDVVGHPLDRVLVAVDVEMRRGDEEVDAVEFLAVDLGVGGQLEQRVERDDRLAVAAALADDARPHGVVELWIVVRLSPRSLLP